MCACVPQSCGNFIEEVVCAKIMKLEKAAVNFQQLRAGKAEEESTDTDEWNGVFFLFKFCPFCLKRKVKRKKTFIKRCEGVEEE